jgi:hypothetical protein
MEAHGIHSCICEQAMQEHVLIHYQGRVLVWSKWYKNGMHHYRVKPNMSMTRISLLSRLIHGQIENKNKLDKV